MHLLPLCKMEDLSSSDQLPAKHFPIKIQTVNQFFNVLNHSIHLCYVTMILFFLI